MRTLVVGLDAACQSVLEPMFADDALPTLASLFEWSAPLESQIPPWTASAWPSLYTGRNPGRHGVFDFLSFEGDDWDVVNSSDLRARTVWEYLDDAGYTSVVVNAPVTHPPRPIDGAVVPGYLAPESPTCHPEGLLADLRAELGEYRVYADRETDERLPDEERVAAYRRLTELRGEAFSHLTDRFDPDFGFLQFQKTDAVFHDFPGDEDSVRAVYEAVDAALENVLATADPDIVIVASDHGIGPYDGHEIGVNELLRREGLAETGTDATVPSWFQVKDEQLVADAGGEDGLLTRLAGLAGRVGLTYQRGRGILERLGLAEFVGRYVSVGAVAAASESVSFRNSPAYLRSPSELGVRLNVADRDPDGVVPESEYEAVRATVVDLLTDLETPAGDPVFETVAPRERYVEGPYAEEAVDVFCVPADFEHGLSVHVGRLFDDPEPYNHKRHGIVAASGAVDTDAPVRSPHLFDIAPTVLATFGLAPDTAMDGDPLPVVSAPDADSYPAFDPADRVRTDSSGVENRLSDLGYLE
jgi:predicted AlkP superfamily phosphohydrolase/phosphomutase